MTWACPSQAALFDHSTLDGILRHYVDQDGYVDYDSIRLNSMTALESYFETMAGTDLAGWPAAERRAFWINAYNAQVLYRVAQNSRLKKMSAAWWILDRPFKVAGGMSSPIDIKRLLRKEGEPRILFSLSDGTLGGPKLCGTAYTADNLDVLLQTNASAFVNSPQNVKVEDGHLQLSKFFNWYARDFQKEGGVQAFISELLNPNQRDDADLMRRLLTMAYRKTTFVYNWTFNDLKNKAVAAPRQTGLPDAVIPPDAFSTSNPDLSKSQ
jgi:hypothetical protein